MSSAIAETNTKSGCGSRFWILAAGPKSPCHPTCRWLRAESCRLARCSGRLSTWTGTWCSPSPCPSTCWWSSSPFAVPEFSGCGSLGVVAEGQHEDVVADIGDDRRGATYVEVGDPRLLINAS